MRSLSVRVPDWAEAGTSRAVPLVGICCCVRPSLSVWWPCLAAFWSWVSRVLASLAGKFEDSRYGSAKNADRLDEHEKRISALETKRS